MQDFCFPSIYKKQTLTTGHHFTFYTATCVVFGIQTRSLTSVTVLPDLLAGGSEPNQFPSNRARPQQVWLFYFGVVAIYNAKFFFVRWSSKSSISFAPDERYLSIFDKSQTWKMPDYFTLEVTSLEVRKWLYKYTVFDTVSVYTHEGLGFRFLPGSVKYRTRMNCFCLNIIQRKHSSWTKKLITLKFFQIFWGSIWELIVIKYICYSLFLWTA